MWGVKLIFFKSNTVRWEWETSESIMSKFTWGDRILCVSNSVHKSDYASDVLNMVLLSGQYWASGANITTVSVVNHQITTCCNIPNLYWNTRYHDNEIKLLSMGKTPWHVTNGVKVVTQWRDWHIYSAFHWNLCVIIWTENMVSRWKWHSYVMTCNANWMYIGWSELQKGLMKDIFPPLITKAPLHWVTCIAWEQQPF